MMKWPNNSFKSSISFKFRKTKCKIGFKNIFVIEALRGFENKIPNSLDTANFIEIIM